MSQFLIKGGKKLKGEVEVGGMKNAAAPILAATLLTSDDCVIDSVPRISDVEKIMEIMKSLGARIEWTAAHQITVNCANVNLQNVDKKMVKSMRASILFLGPLLARFKEVTLPEPGGCIIGNRPIDAHLFALQKLGAEISKEKEFFNLKTAGLKGAEIILPEFSVTATENALMAASLADGVTTIKLAAAEPHVQDLISFLNKMGAKIQGVGTHTLKINGVKKLNGARHELIPDQIEIGTFAVAAAATDGEISIHPIVSEHLDKILSVLSSIGVNWEVKGDAFLIHHSHPLKAFKLQTMPYPGFPTDLQAPFGVLATQCQGTSLIHDPLFEGRLGYINELIKMGANAVICDPHRVLITGPMPLYAQEIKSFDLRAGATMIIAGLIAEGETILNEAEIVYRGYERIDEKLRALGADIKFIK
ncbi:MAG TPA: UDP-N-acetylglucosamine 1-carboxyvinyltransferase [Candidatus Magasanikbacteria bacterium]|uniref:UDP-N-acetylglucosamine 1-carboxyvinyltransferase n=1 Tax=Candidatus Magasanikbacteria bacterium GW2011_GWC2_41_17 TaxID=1619048 RepID=A0A0G0XM13_9BACT|nr:MAG: UDP-N-acetylglucosamine 1-carboxyvinyltransferase [Candidatus Magasanikbacteria bacterium GW2011_GWC2_41_17]HBV58372.1 UDP-N-acetylglucosamine 1-carboxyvinyltransferase [Candidatus Magasanikbacteria bacterium]HBX16422.1 UDP-N-acetylglucosamine 1-carboxyvinyltransferase [Candidatus Magasanikbacteria bacterium]